MLNERLLGIYFINYLMRGGGCGMAEENGERFGYLVFNPQVLKANITDYLAYQELSLFNPGDPWLQVTIDCGTTLPAIQYLLLRESTRLVDAALGISTPAPPAPCPFTDGIWQTPDMPMKAFDFPARTALNYSGLDATKAIPFDKVKACYQQLQLTPFVSLFSCRSAADDLAEFVAFYHLTQKLHAPYKMSLHHDFPTLEIRFVYEPMKSPLVMQRFAAIARFYQEKQ